MYFCIIWSHMCGSIFWTIAQKHFNWKKKTSFTQNKMKLNGIIFGSVEVRFVYVSVNRVDLILFTNLKNNCHLFLNLFSWKKFLWPTCKYKNCWRQENLNCSSKDPFINGKFAHNFYHRHFKPKKVSDGWLVPGRQWRGWSLKIFWTFSYLIWYSLRLLLSLNFKVFEDW